MNIPVFDLHCDTANELSGFGGTQVSNLRTNSAHIDLERASKLGGYAQCFACFTSISEKYDPVVAFEKKLAAIIREVEKNPDLIRIAYNAKDIEENA